MREISLLRREDERRTDVVSQFLDNNVYNHMDNFERVNDRNRQVIGIDVIFDREGKHYICDEKAAIRYINKNLQTFSFELSFINRNGEIQDGWLLSDRNVNNSYMCVWIDSASPDDLIDTDSIKSIQCSLVTKNAIMDYINSCGWTKQMLEKKCKRIQENYNENYGNIARNGIKFSFSDKLVEKPVNILLPRKEITRISDYTFKI